ncbi:MAG: hypothetical protein JXA10_18780 [Anaerolineae bacterium]|nr:hypothetical protein [Anaerolineae bacterium]
MKLPPLFNRPLRDQIQTLLINHADAILIGAADRERLLEPYDNVLREQAESLFIVAERINDALIEVVPSEQFVTQLRYDLLATAQAQRESWLDRIRSLPPRTQLAAGIGGATLTAGMVLIATRSMPNALEYWRNLRDA